MRLITIKMCNCMTALKYIYIYIFHQEFQRAKCVGHLIIYPSVTSQVGESIQMCDGLKSGDGINWYHVTQGLLW